MTSTIRGVPAAVLVLAELLERDRVRRVPVPAWELARDLALPDATVDMALAELAEARMVRVPLTSMGYVPTLRAVHEAEVSAQSVAA